MRNNIDEIIQKLPQTDPFRFVDEVVEINLETEKCIVKKYVNESEYYFEGHFPGKPIMPGCLMIECMAQSAEVFLLYREKNMSVKNAYLVQVKKVKYYNKVVPNTSITIETRVVRKLGEMLEIESTIMDENHKKVASGSLVLMLEIE